MRDFVTNQERTGVTPDNIWRSLGRLLIEILLIWLIIGCFFVGVWYV